VQPFEITREELWLMAHRSVGKDNQDILVKIGDDTGDQLQAQHGALAKLSDTVTETNVLVSKTNTICSRTADELSDHLTAEHGTLAKISDTVTETSALVSQTSVLASQTNALMSKTHSVSGRILDELADHFDSQHKALVKVSDTASETNSLASQTNKLSSQVISRLTQIGDLCTQVKSAVSKLLWINVATYRMIQALTISLPGHLERSLFTEPFVLEDAIGRICPVHLQFIPSWEAFDAVLEARFRGVQGHDKVQRGHWTLQDHATGRDVCRGRSWEGAFLPGQRVDMSILFHSETSVDSPAQMPTRNSAACPSCQADVSETLDAETRWCVRQLPVPAY
jgi:hypothetical protein